MDTAFTIRSGSVKKSGHGALFATSRSISSGDLEQGLLEPGARLPRSPESAEVSRGDVLVALRGPVNAAAAVKRTFEQPLFATLELAVIRPDETLDGGYLAWFINLASTQAALAGERLAGGVARLPLSALERLPLRIPPFDVQRRIAAAAALGRSERRLTERLMKHRADYLDAALAAAISAY